jgi:pSer/pThr/pTyr-binding forkhead associated (FHA) protein
MTEPWLQFVLPAVVAGIFGIGSAILAARLSAAAQRKHSEREMKSHRETLEREFAERYAEIKATNREHAHAIRQQFAKAYVHVAAADSRAAERYFISSGAKLTIGRAPNCDIILDDVSISRQCAMIEMSEDELYIRDLHSTNGLFVNGNRLAGGQRIALRDGDNLSFGQVDATIRLLGRSVFPLP